MPESSSHRRRHRRRSNRKSRHDSAGRGSRTRGWLFGLFKWGVIAGLAMAVLGAGGLGYLYYQIAPTLPEVQSLREVQLQMPMRVFTNDGKLIAEYGEKRREPIQISQVPDSLKNAIIASEDDSFYQHPGVSLKGLARAGWHLVKTGSKGPGGSTITMQVARNFFLSNERTYSRKLTEIFLALKIEHELSKDDILELYINKIYLGNRSYGFAAASRVYYGKPIQKLNLAESAMLAGLPKAPSTYNPIINPERALIRRNYVLGRLHDLGKITTAEYRRTLAVEDTASLHYSEPETEADYVGEMARARVKQLYGNKWATAGFKVFTTLRSDAQAGANRALRESLYDYEERHGYRGAVLKLEPAELEDRVALLERLESLPEPGDLLPAAVLSVTAEKAGLLGADGKQYELQLEDVQWARKRISVDSQGDEISKVDQVLHPGDVIHLQMRKDGTKRFVQQPVVEGAFVAMHPRTGDILALVGGFDFNRSKFNRATQARRQPGSTFKPFIYSAALAAGDTAATIYNDAPVVFHDAALEGEWRPSNDSGRFYGPTRLREALVKSRNLVSVRVLREIGVPFAIDYATRFGFARRNLPPDLSLALGSAAVTPMELTTAFGVFANGGYRVQPHFIERIEDPRGKIIYSTPKTVLCDDCSPGDKNPLQAEMDAEVEEPTGDVLPIDEDPAGTQIGGIDAADSPGEQAGSEKGKRSVEPLVDELDTVDAPRVIDERNAYIMSSMMREVVRRGTGRRAGEALGRQDFGGKTGTTNNQLDAWFAGFNTDIVAAAWIGSDGLDPLGRNEYGGVAALPMWTAFMQGQLDNLSDELPPEPAGIETIRIDRQTGEPASGDSSMLELFMEDNMPEVGNSDGSENGGKQGSGNGTLSDARNRREQAREVEQLF